MLESLVFLCVDGFCGERDFARRRRLTPYAFFYYVVNVFCRELCGCRHTSVSGDMNALEAGVAGQVGTVELEHLSAVCLCGVGFSRVIIFRLE